MPTLAVSSTSDSKALNTLVGATIFVSAFLLFQVQPVVGKAILPRFGGSAAVWTSCMLFFQGMLLAGYLYAHASVSLLAPVWQRRVHVVLLVAAIAALPILPGPASEALARTDPGLAIAGTLLACVGLPYFLLSTTGPLVQAWVTQLRPGAVPYRLFALSNLASLLALLTYPIAVEPFVSVRWQGWAWSAAFVLFALLCAALAWHGAPAGSVRHRAIQAARSPAPGAAAYLSWLLLAACPSVLLLAITNHLTQDIAPIPFLWIVPLVLYLLSFILCFERAGLYRRTIFLPLAAVALVGMDYLLVDVHDASLKVRVLTPLFSLGLFVCCMACHGELARSKPAPDRLTAFYLAVSAGGVLGGVLVGVVAPRVFDDYHELPLAFVATAACLAWVVMRDQGSPVRGSRQLASYLVLLLVPLFLAQRVIGRVAESADSTETVARNFFGTLKVMDSGEGQGAYRTLMHGGTEHGGQFADASLRSTPTSYYSPQSGVGLAILQGQAGGPMKVGVIGLGTGTLAAYSRPGDNYLFYDINPLVVDIARSKFSYLADAKGSTAIVMGDARVSLERQAPQRFDVLVVDAFSGDSIPIHLLTAQAFAEYFRHLAPTGVLAVHTSNRYLDLNPVVKSAAARFGKNTLLVEQTSDRPRQVNASSWVLVAQPGNAIFDRLRDLATEEDAAPPLRLWTDDYSSVLTVVRALQRRAPKDEGPRVAHGSPDQGSDTQGKRNKETREGKT
jgi:SAM-dependent methyltransferase